MTYRFDDKFERNTVRLVWFFVEVIAVDGRVTFFGIALLFRNDFCVQVYVIGKRTNRVLGAEFLIYFASVDLVDTNVGKTSIVKVRLFL